jgi:hypothetical protein
MRGIFFEPTCQDPESFGVALTVTNRSPIVCKRDSKPLSDPDSFHMTLYGFSVSRSPRLLVPGFVFDVLAAWLVLALAPVPLTAADNIASAMSMITHTTRTKAKITVFSAARNSAQDIRGKGNF